jgi:hypothetical protein
MSELIKKYSVLILTAIVAMTMILNFYLIIPGLSLLAEELQSWAYIIQLLAVELGISNILLGHSRVIKRREKGRWVYSLWLIVLFFIALILGLIRITKEIQGPLLPDWLRTQWLTLSSTTYSLTGFYIFSAAYKAFRIKNLDSAILLMAGCFVILTNAPIGEVIWSGIPVIGRWMLDFGQVPSMRALMITGAFGTLAFGFRMLIGKERAYFVEVDG